MSEYDDLKTTYESMIIQSNGIRVHVTIEVPVTVRWKDEGESAELAQMCAGRATAMIRESMNKAPF